MKNILMMVGMCLTILFGYNMTNPVAEANTHAVREVKVQAGDTMWDIAARTAHKDMDVREMVYAMKELNKINYRITDVYFQNNLFESQIFITVFTETEVNRVEYLTLQGLCHFPHQCCVCIR